MLNRTMVQDRLDQIRASVNRLARLADMSREEFLSDPDAFAVAEHHLRRSLEDVLDIGRHIVSKKGLGKPEDYSEVITLLGQHGVLPTEFTRQIRGIAGYRNRLVHLYAEVTPSEIYDLITNRLEDLGEFSRLIMAYLDAETTK
ncbi:MAG: DUF86 domain-containing protein [Actinobacteria bacterium]|nr:DUF86 domain-containing protein [Actinomycetota bacterium]